MCEEIVIMLVQSAVRRIIYLLALVAAPLAMTSGVTAQTNSAPERFTAFAVNMGSPGRAGAGTVEITINRWSTEAEHDRLLSVLTERGPEKLLDALRDNPKVGYIRTPNSIGYDLHYARRFPGEDGGERVVIATDRYIRFREAVNRPRSIDYPFTVIELHIKPDGEGEGKMSLATKIIADKENGSIVLENYSTQPVMLTEVKKESTNH
jgi:hypothetical protein